MVKRRNRKLQTSPDNHFSRVTRGIQYYKTTLTNSLGYVDGFASSVWPMGTNLNFHNTGTSEGGDFGELNKLNWDNQIELYTPEVGPYAISSSGMFTASNHSFGRVSTATAMACNDAGGGSATAPGLVNIRREVGIDGSILLAWTGSGTATKYGFSSPNSGAFGHAGQLRSDLLKVNSEGFFEFAVSGAIEDSSLPWCIRVALQPYKYKSVDGADTDGYPTCYSASVFNNATDAYYSPAAGGSWHLDDCTAPIIMQIGTYSIPTDNLQYPPPDASQGPNTVAVWLSGADASLPTDSGCNGTFDQMGNQIYRFVGGQNMLRRSGGKGSPLIDRYRIRRVYNKSYDFRDSGETGVPGNYFDYSVSPWEFQFQRSAGSSSCWETFHKENMATLLDEGPTGCFGVNGVREILSQSYFLVVDFSSSGNDSASPVVGPSSFFSGSVVNFETRGKELTCYATASKTAKCRSPAHHSKYSRAATASISYLYPSGFITNDVGIPSGNYDQNLYKDYGLMWDVSSERSRLMGEARYPSFNSYEDFAEDLRYGAKEYSILPEFRISEHMDYYVEQDSFFGKNRKFLSLDGGDITASAQSETSSFDASFLEEYCDSDFLSDFDLLTHQHTSVGTLGSPTELTLTCKGIMKLLPYEGFYPITRTTQLATLFQEEFDFSSSTGGRSLELQHFNRTENCWKSVTEEDYSKNPQWQGIKTQGLTTPFFAPGILYNSIKSGIGVGWTVMTGTNLQQSYMMPDTGISSSLEGEPGLDNTISSTAVITGTYLNTCVYQNPALAKKIGFDTLWDMSKFEWGGKNTPLALGSYHIGYPEVLSGYFTSSMGRTYDTGSKYAEYQNENFMLRWNGNAHPTKGGRYALAMNNFLAESTRFFLKEQFRAPRRTNSPLEKVPEKAYLTSFSARPFGLIAGNFQQGTTYYMDVILEKTDDFVMCESYFNKSRKYYNQFPVRNKNYTLQLGTELPLFQEWDLEPKTKLGAEPNPTDVYNFSCSFDGRYFGPATRKWGARWDWASASHGAHYNVADPAQAPFTPPYFYGRSIARIRYTAGDEWTNLNQNTPAAFIKNMEIAYLNPDLEDKINEGNYNANIPVISTFINTGSDAGEIGTSSFNTTGSFAYKKAMNVGDSINLNGLFNVVAKTRNPNTGKIEQVQEEFEAENSHWVIYPKYECPSLNFVNQSTGTITIGGGLHPTCSFSASIDSAVFGSGYLDNVAIGLGRGMWSGYGQIPSRNSGIKLRLAQTPDLADERGWPYGKPIDPERHKSLLDAAEFSLIEKSADMTNGKFLGRLGGSEGEKTISEAIVAIPYSTTQYNEEPGGFAPTINIKSPLRDLFNNRFLFKIPLSVWGSQIDEFAGRTAAGQTPTTITTMYENMKKFVIPPQLDFRTNTSITPFVMYIFPFEKALEQVDLQDIWQGVLPKIGTTSEWAQEPPFITHAIGDADVNREQFFTGYKIPPTIRWMVFKVKQKAEFSYANITLDTTDDTRIAGLDRQVGTIDYSYNWPYDFCSLVELAKLEVQFKISGSGP